VFLSERVLGPRQVALMLAGQEPRWRSNLLPQNKAALEVQWTHVKCRQLAAVKANNHDGGDRMRM
jgi:hypothetical protein